MRMLFTPLLLSTALVLSACSDSNQNHTTTEEKQLSTNSIKSFVPHEHDQHDIQILSDYEQRFSAMSDASEDELIAMQEAGTLSENFITLRKHDTIRSALVMLKDLDLKTPQGRYIQGLMYQYWEKQDQYYNQYAAGKTTLSNSSIAMQGIEDFIHANEQLEQWREQYPALSD